MPRAERAERPCRQSFSPFFNSKMSTPCLNFLRSSNSPISLPRRFCRQSLPMIHEPWLLFLLESTIRKAKLATTATSSSTANMVGPIRSSNPACPLWRIDLARQWYVLSA